MQCKICGSNLVRGFTFCLECGTPVPPEMLEENTNHGPQEITPPNVSKPQPEEPVGDLQPKLIGGEQDRGEALKPQLIGGDTFEQGKALKPKIMGIGDDEAGEALKPRLIGGEEQAGGGERVQATLQNSSADVSDTAVEKLVFCPNCGMHMQHNPGKCEICGMTLGNKPNNVPTTSSGIPLFNTDPDPFSGTGGSFTGGFGSFSDADVSRIDNFVNGNTDPMFNSGGSAFNVQATPADFAHLTEQIAGFSTSAVPDIGVTENTRIRQKAVPKGEDVELSDFLMTDDLQSESIPMSDKHVPVVGDYSMEENPDEDINIDPFAFVSMSMDEAPQMPVSEARLEAAELPPAVEEITPEPIQPQITQFIAEETPVISEASPSEPFANSAPKYPEAAPPQQAQPYQQPQQPQAQPYQQPQQPQAQPYQQPQQPQAQPYQQPQQPQAQPYQQPQQPQAQPYQQPQQAQAQPYQQPQQAQAQPYQQPQQTQAPPEKTKKCFACGRSMPVNNKFCPNCGRSMFGIPNPNLMQPQPQPAPPRTKKKHIAIIVVAIILVAAAAVAFFVLKGNAAELDLGELAQTVSDIAGYFIS